MMIRGAIFLYSVLSLLLIIFNSYFYKFLANVDYCHVDFFRIYLFILFIILLSIILSKYFALNFTLHVT